MRSTTYGLVLGTILAGLCLCAGGCASVYSVGQHNVAVDRALAVRADQHGATVGVDLLALNRGYFAAWADMPGQMTLSTLADAVGTGLASYGAYKALHQSSGASASPATYNYTVTGDNNTFNGVTP